MDWIFAYGARFHGCGGQGRFAAGADCFAGFINDAVTEFGILFTVKTFGIFSGNDSFPFRDIQFRCIAGHGTGFDSRGDVITSRVFQRSISDGIIGVRRSFDRGPVLVPLIGESISAGVRFQVGGITRCLAVRVGNNDTVSAIVCTDDFIDLQNTFCSTGDGFAVFVPLIG